MIEITILLLIITLLVQLLTLSILLNEKGPYIPPKRDNILLTSRPKPDKIDKSKIIKFRKGRDNE